MNNLVVEERFDSKGNLIYEKLSHGYYECNDYNNDNELIRTECHFTNGMVEVEKYNK